MTGIAPVEVTMHMTAAPGDVFPYFTDPARYVQWMGSEATLEPEPGGIYRVHMSDGFKAAGTFRQAEATSGNAMPPGSTRVTVTLEDEDGGTRLTLRHDDLPNPELREGHRIAWET